MAIALRTGPFDVIRALPPGVWRTALLATAALLVYHPGPIPALRSWGFHFPIYLPGWGQVALWGFALIAAALPAGPQLLLKLARGWGHLLGGDGDSSRHRRGGDLLIPLGLTLLFWLLRSKYAFLGDNWLRLEQAVRGESLPYKWGSMLLAHHALALGESLWQLSPRAVFALLNTAAGFPFAVGTVLLARCLGSSTEHRGLIHLGLLGIGAIQLFCGYVEVYSWAFASLTLALAATLRIADGRSRLWGVVLFGFAAAFHLISLLFVLPLALLLLPGGRARLHQGVGIWVGPWTVRLSGLALTAGAAAAPFFAPQLLHGYAAGNGDLSLFHPALWWERVNGLLLASPAGFLAGIVLLVQGFGSGRIIGGQRLLLAAAVLPALLGLVIMKMVLGAADWDIIAFVGLPLLLWTTAHAGRSSRLGRETMAFLVLLSLGNTWGFVLVNNGEASLTRIRDIVSTDPAPYYSSHPAGLHLASLFGANGLTR